MPYTIVKVSGKYRLKNADTGELMPAKHDTRIMAEAQARAIMASENGRKMADEMMRRRKR